MHANTVLGPQQELSLGPQQVRLLGPLLGLQGAALGALETLGGLGTLGAWACSGAILLRL